MNRDLTISVLSFSRSPASFSRPLFILLPLQVSFLLFPSTVTVQRQLTVLGTTDAVVSWGGQGFTVSDIVPWTSALNFMLPQDLTPSVREESCKKSTLKEIFTEDST